MSLSPRQQASDAEQARWFAEEVQPHEPALRVWLRNRYPNLDEVDDVVNESYLNLLRTRPTGRIKVTKAYFFAVARNAALRIFRKRRIFSDTPVNELPDWRLLDGGANVTEIVNHQEEEDLVAEAITHLPERCREIVLLRSVHGLSNSDIAAKLGLSEATVRVQVARGIRKCTHFLRNRSVVTDP